MPQPARRAGPRRLTRPAPSLTACGRRQRGRTEPGVAGPGLPLAGPSITSPPAEVGTTPAAESRAATPAPRLVLSLALLPRVQAASASVVTAIAIVRVMSSSARGIVGSHVHAPC